MGSPVKFIMPPNACAIGDWRGAIGGATVYMFGNVSGIADENLARVFEPFFTTRDIGQGLGLGLSISYAVIERHGGLLFAESELGSWASFSFDLSRAP